MQAEDLQLLVTRRMSFGKYKLVCAPRGAEKQNRAAAGPDARD
jgi:hypothetical protein